MRDWRYLNTRNRRFACGVIVVCRRLHAVLNEPKEERNEDSCTRFPGGRRRAGAGLVRRHVVAAGRQRIVLPLRRELSFPLLYPFSPLRGEGGSLTGSGGGISRLPACSGGTRARAQSIARRASRALTAAFNRIQS